MYANHMKSNITSLSLFTLYSAQFSSVQLLSCVRLCAIPWNAAHEASLSITNSQNLPKLMSIELVMPSNHLILSSPLPPPLNLSRHQGLFKWVSSSHHVAKVLEFQLNISPSNEYSGLISFRMDWLDLLVVKGPLKSLLQHHSSKASILRRSAFFTVQLSHPYRTTGKTTALTEYSVSLVCVCMYIHMCAQLCLTFLQPHVLKPARLLCPWILQGRTLAWVATSSSRGSFRPTDLINGATWEAHSILLEVCN